MRKAWMLLVAIMLTAVSGCGAVPRSFYDIDDPAVVLYRSARPGWFREPRHWLDTLEAFAGERHHGEGTMLADVANDTELSTRRAMALIEHYHVSYEMALYIQVAAGETLFDVTQLGIGLATAAAGSESVKGALGVALAAVKGVELSLSENFLQNQTSLAIITTMQANRLAARARIEERLHRAPYGSSIEAESDLLDYFAAGSLSRAVSALASEAEARVATQRAALDQTRRASSNRKN